jgi:two-component system response regulator
MQSKTILLLEDNADDAELARAAFARSAVEHSLIVLDDGVDALDYLLCRGPHAEDPPAVPDVLLLDLKLPGIDGFDVLRKLRSEERTAALSVVVFTSSVEAQDVSRCYRLGASSYVRKPIDFDEFLRVAEQILRYWLGLNVPPLKEVAT